MYGEAYWAMYKDEEMYGEMFKDEEMYGGNVSSVGIIYLNH